MAAAAAAVVVSSVVAVASFAVALLARWCRAVAAAAESWCRAARGCSPPGGRRRSPQGGEGAGRGTATRVVAAYRRGTVGTAPGTAH